VIVAILFLFNTQNTKNGIAYSLALINVFFVLTFLRRSPIKFWHQLVLLLIVGAVAVTILIPHFQKNNTWRTFASDARVGLKLEQYPQWKFCGEQGLPNNEFGQVVSATNYLRVAWFKVGVQLAAQDPWGYGLVEDSFKRVVRAKWPEASPNLSHSHSGWLDLILGLGFPGVFCILGALFMSIGQSLGAAQPWKYMIIWALSASLILWITSETAATISFSLLIFWISWACGLTLIRSDPKMLLAKD
jgi:hypothetical protein